MGDDDPTPAPATKPTRAGMEELQRRLDDAIRALTDTTGQLHDLHRDRDAWRDAKAPDNEAEAIAGCVRAIDGMLNQRNMSGNVGGVTYHGSRRPRPFERSAADTPVGRVVLHLIARYGVPLVDAPPPEPGLTERRIVSVPAHVADQLGDALRVDL